MGRMITSRDMIAVSAVGRVGKAALFSAFLSIAGFASSSQAADIVVTQWGVAMSGSEFGVALDQGLFKKVNAPVDDVIPTQGGGTTVRSTTAGGIGYGVVSLSAAISAIRAGEDIKIVNAGVYSTGESVIVTMPNSPVKTLADLRGKSIGITNPKSLTEQIVVTALEHEKLAANSVQRHAFGSISGALTALESGAADAAVIVEPVWSLRRSKYRMVFDSRNLPKFVTIVGIATGDLIREKPDQLRAILQARRAAVKSIYADPAAAAKSIAKYFKDVPEDVMKPLVANLVNAGYWSEGDINIEELEKAAAGLRAIGAITGDINWEQMVDRSFLQPK